MSNIQSELDFKCDGSSSDNEDDCQTSLIEETHDHSRYMAHNEKDTVDMAMSNNQTRIDLSRSVLICKEYAMREVQNENKESSFVGESYIDHVKKSVDYELKQTAGVSFTTEHMGGIAYRAETGPIAASAETSMQERKIAECCVKQEKMESDSHSAAKSENFESSGYNVNYFEMIESHRTENNKEMDEDQIKDDASENYQQSDTTAIENTIKKEIKEDTSENYLNIQEDDSTDINDLEYNRICAEIIESNQIKNEKEECEYQIKTEDLETDRSIEDDKATYACPVCGHISSLGDLCSEIRGFTVKCDRCQQWIRVTLSPETKGISVERYYKCPKCPQVFLSKQTFSKHEKKHLTVKQKNNNSTEKKEKTQLSEKQKKKHLPEKQEKKQLTDKQEKKLLTEKLLKRELKKHEMIQLGEKLFKYKCHYCDELFINLSRRKQHEIRKHTKEKLYKCSFCDKRFIEKCDCRKHEMIHTGERPFMCDFCGKTFNRMQYLNLHKMLHTGEGPYQCDTCGERCKDSRSLRNHQQVHTGTMPFKCKHCEKGFHCNTSLKKHEIEHTDEKPYKCKNCEKCFHCNNSLKKHELVHTWERRYKCNYCEKSFYCKSHHTKHERVHTGEKPYRCQYCGRAFKDTSALKKHIRIHTGEKPYACGVCGKRFAQSNACKGHEKIHIKDKITSNKSSPKAKSSLK